MFDIKSEIFQNIYRDTVKELNERGFLFEDDPELISLQHSIKSSQSIPTTAQLQPIPLASNSILSTDQSAVFNDAEVLKSAMGVSQTQSQSQTQIQPRPIEEEVWMNEWMIIVFFSSSEVTITIIIIINNTLQFYCILFLLVEWWIFNFGKHG